MKTPEETVPNGPEISDEIVLLSYSQHNCEMPSSCNINHRLEDIGGKKVKCFAAGKLLHDLTFGMNSIAIILDTLETRIL